MLTATVRASERDDRRDFDRTTVNRTSTARDSNAVPNDVVVSDFSREGIGFTTSASFEIGDEITVGLSGGGSVNGRVVRRHRDVYGCVFTKPLDHRQMEEAFGVSAVRPFQAGTPDRAAMADPVTPRWSGVTRLAILLTGIIVGWATVAAVIYISLA